MYSKCILNFNVTTILRKRLDFVSGILKPIDISPFHIHSVALDPGRFHLHNSLPLFHKPIYNKNYYNRLFNKFILLCLICLGADHESNAWSGRLFHIFAHCCAETTRLSL